MKGPLRVPVLPDRDLGRHLPGNGRRQRIGRQDQDDHINVVGGPVISVSLIADDGCQRRPIEQADDPDDDRRHRQHPRLGRYTASAGSLPFLSIHLFFIHTACAVLSL